MPRFLGIDYGNKRLGLAVGDSDAKLATPVTTLPAAGTFSEQAKAVLGHARNYDIDEFVVGLPLNMDDTEGPQAKRTRQFGNELQRQSGKPVHYWDERLSSATADELLQPAQLTRKKHKARRDRVAAQVILQGFLEERA